MAAKEHWTKGHGVFWLTFAGLIFVAINTIYTGQLVRDARDTAKRQLRAYVFVESIGPLKLEAGTRPSVEVTIKNAGLTPAYNVLTVRNYTASIYPTNEFPTQEPDEISRGTLGPGGIFELSGEAKSAIPSELEAEIFSGKRAFYVYGTIIYSDAFGARHVTKFRSYYRGSGLRPAPGAVLLLKQSDAGNESD